MTSNVSRSKMPLQYQQEGKVKTVWPWELIYPPGSEFGIHWCLSSGPLGMRRSRRRTLLFPQVSGMQTLSDTSGKQCCHQYSSKQWNENAITGRPFYFGNMDTMICISGTLSGRGCWCQSQLSLSEGAITSWINHNFNTGPHGKTNNVQLATRDNEKSVD